MAPDLGAERSVDFDAFESHGHKRLRACPAKVREQGARHLEAGVQQRGVRPVPWQVGHQRLARPDQPQRRVGAPPELIDPPERSAVLQPHVVEAPVVLIHRDLFRAAPSGLLETAVYGGGSARR